VIKRARRDDFVYLDPPYHPTTKTSNFTSYTQNAFGEKEQRELAQVYCELDRKGCQVMLSNSWSPFIQELYDGFHMIEVRATRMINSNAGKRGRVSEAVVVNYET
jgi:DNA adenine methylase